MGIIDIPQQTVVRAARGDIRAFEEIYRSFSPFVYTVALRMVRGHEGAEDITQEVFLKIYKNVWKFRFRSSLKTWIYRVTFNTVLNFLRKYPSGRYIEMKDPAQYAVEPDVYEHIRKEDNRQRLDTLLEKLNPDQRACIVLRELQGFSYEEIAQTLRIKINTVRSRLKRARRILMNEAKEVVTNEV